MNMPSEIDINKPDYSGKVRDIFDLGDSLVIVASDRLSAFDVIFNEPIPDKGKILTQISNHWFQLIDIVQNHIIETDVKKFPQAFHPYTYQLENRSVWVKKAKRIDFECVVRGYLMGSGYKEYNKSKTVTGISLPDNLSLGDQLPEPIFTPATKADSGHDENVSFDIMAEAIGSNIADKLKETSIKIFQYASKKLYDSGIILADTKFEFGILNNEVILIDEVLTPDSSRFFERDEYEQARKNGKLPPSMDKQVVRDYLETLDWDKNPPPPALPEEIIKETQRRYKKIGDTIALLS